MLSEPAKKVQQNLPPWRTIPVDFFSKVASTQTLRAVDIQNKFSFSLSKRNIPSVATQPSQIGRNQPIPLDPYHARFQDEQYLSTMLNLAEETFSGPGSRTAARSFTASSQVPLVPKARLKDLFCTEKFITGATRSDVAVQDGLSNFASIPDLGLNAPEERRYANSNIPPLNAPCTVPDGSSNVMDILHSSEQNNTPLPKSSKPPSHEPERPVDDSQDPWADYIPSPIPEEVQALINAYIYGRPFNLMVARSRLHNYWNLALPEEFGFVMMGFFRVLSIQVRPFFSFLQNDF